MNNFRELGFFMLLQRSGSMTEAARELDITPAAVSKRLATMEKRLGIQLVNRSTRSMSLTPDGQVYYDYAQQALASLKEMEDRLAQRDGELKGLLKINAPLGFGRKYMTSIISEFMKHNPKVEIKMYLSDHPLDLAEEGYDIGIRFGELPDSSLHASRIAAHRRVLCASPGYIEQYGAPHHPDDLSKHNCIILQQNRDAWSVWKLKRKSRLYSVQVHGNLTSNDGESVLKWALEGKGVAIRAEWDVARYLKDDRLRIVLPKYSLPNADIHAVYQHHNHLPMRVRAFIKFMKEYMSGQKIFMSDS